MGDTINLRRTHLPQTHSVCLKNAKTSHTSMPPPHTHMITYMLVFCLNDLWGNIQLCYLHIYTSSPLCLVSCQALSHIYLTIHLLCSLRTCLHLTLFHKYSPANSVAIYKHICANTPHAQTGSSCRSMHIRYSTPHLRAASEYIINSLSHTHMHTYLIWDK